MPPTPPRLTFHSLPINQPRAVYELDVDDRDVTRTATSTADDDKPSNLAGLIDEVMVVETIAEAKRVFKILMDNVGDADRPVYHLSLIHI